MINDKIIAEEVLPVHIRMRMNRKPANISSERESLVSELTGTRGTYIWSKPRLFTYHRPWWHGCRAKMKPRVMDNFDPQDVCIE